MHCIQSWLCYLYITPFSHVLVELRSFQYGRSCTTTLFLPSSLRPSLFPVASMAQVPVLPPNAEVQAVLPPGEPQADLPQVEQAAEPPVEVVGYL